MKTIIVLSLLLFLVIGAAPTAAAQKWIKISKKEYSVKAPSDWTIDSSKQMGTDLVIFSMLENGSDKFRENINVLIQNLAGMNINLEKYTAISTGQVKTMAPDAAMVESKTMKAGSTTFQKIIYTATQSGVKLKFEQYYFIANKKAYVITFTAELAKFEIFKPVGEEILNSFVLK